MHNGQVTYLPEGWEPPKNSKVETFRRFECSQRGDHWSDVTAPSPGQAAILQAKLWMTMGYTLPMYVTVRRKGSDEAHRYRVAASEIAATLVDSEEDVFDVIRLEL